ncbi:MAG TPA: GTP cyclohydrolase I FolE [Alphaproteobacteria bacterium]|nr:GTP cyclohydrolase I FolE [Alphaproteobacteria bacterium]USO05314.1 MAG: GTP cyclohydrolase I FolE [Rhodospirillales bacterium]HOO81223.1 GTP cyclohydrolase I FolE [Alphaproteobacteria bacterium]
MVSSKIVEIGSDKKPSREEAEEAIRILLRYIGEDPAREGLIETPARVVRAYDEFFEGYNQNPAKELSKTFEDIEGFDDIVLVKDIEFTSHCEHHMVPINGVAHVAYWPDEKVVGISKLARIVDILSSRLISQENMTSGIAECIETTLKPKGVAVYIDADHQCMSIRGVKKRQSSTVTSTFTGKFKEEAVQTRFLRMIDKN